LIRRTFTSSNGIWAFLATLPALILLGAFAPSAFATASGAISGKVTNVSTEAPIEGIEACAFSTANEAPEEELEGAYGCAKTGSKGEYTITGLDAGEYVVFFGSPNPATLDYVSQLYDDKPASGEPTLVKVATSTVTEIDAALQEGSEISGTITNASTGAPVEHALACALRPGSQGGVEAVSCAPSAANGEYTIGGLPDGSFEIGFVGLNLATQYYPDKASFPEGTAVTISAAKEDKTGIDAAMQPSANTTPTSTLPTGTMPGSQLPGIGTTKGPLATVKLAVSLSSRRLGVRDSSAVVKLTCAGSTSCHGKLVLTAKHEVRHKGKTVIQTVTIGVGRYTLSHGRTAAVKIKLDTRASRILSSDRGRLSARLAISQLAPSPAGAQLESVELIEHENPAKR
jgi:hypothetical protein